MTIGERVADWVASSSGSWRFIIVQSALLTAWVAANLTGVVKLDPMPFILLNLLLSLQAAYTGPLVLLSSNRQAARDRAEAHADYVADMETNRRLAALAADVAAIRRAVGS